MRLTIQLGISLLCLCLSTLAQAAGAWDYIPNQDQMKALKEAGLVTESPLPGGGHRVSYPLLETFEASKVTTRAQQTVFGLCQADYHPVLSGGYTLMALTIDYVIVDYQGRLDKSGASWRITFHPSDGTKSKADKGPSAKKFHEGLPEWAKQNLHLLSGFLSNKPGNTPIAYGASEAEVAVSILGIVLDFAPGVAKNAIGELLENLLKKLTSVGLTEAAANKELRWGRANRITNADILQHKKVYEAEGAKMWNF